MKRFLSILAAALIIIATLAACGGNTDNAGKTDGAGADSKAADSAESAESVDLSALLRDINSTYALTDLKAVEDTKGLNRYYQIEPDDVKQFAAELTKSASDYTEIILIEAADSSAADRIEAKLEERLRSQLSNAKSYDAEQVDMLEGCNVMNDSGFVWLVIGDKHLEINAMVEEAIK